MRRAVSIVRLWALVTTCGPACFSTSSYGGLDVNGYLFAVEPVNMAARTRGEQATATVVLRRNDGLALPQIDYAVAANNCHIVVNPGATDSNGVGRAELDDCAAGLTSVSATMQLPHFLFELPATRPILAFSANPGGTVPSGTPLNAAITPRDHLGLPDPTYHGTVQFISTDPNATLPSDYSFGPADHGQAILKNAVILRSIGLQTITARDARTGATISEEVLDVGAPLVDTYALTLKAPTQVTAGVPFAADVAAVDSLGAALPSFTGALALSSSDPNATLPSGLVIDASDVAHKHLGALVFTTPGPQQLSVDVAGVYQASVTVNVLPGPAAKLVWSPLPPVVAGAFTLAQLNALDAFGNLASSYQGFVHVRTSDAHAKLFPYVQFYPNGAGVASIYIVFATPGLQSLTAVDTTQPALTGELDAISVSRGAAQELIASPTGPWMAGVATPITVTAVDAAGNPVLGWNDGAHWTADDPNAQLPSDAASTFMPDTGTLTVPVTLLRAGSTLLTVQDSNSALPPLFIHVDVVPAPARVLTVNGPTTTTAGVAVALSLSAFDDFGNLATGYTGSVTLTTSDPHTSPGTFTFTLADAGHGLAGVTLLSSGPQHVWVSDAQDTNLAAGPFDINVLPAASARLVLQLPSSATACHPVSDGNIEVVDPYGNLVMDYTGSASVRSSDANTNALVGIVITNGAASLAGLIPYHASAQTLSATDDANQLLGASAILNVHPGPASVLQWDLLPTSVVAGSSASVTVGALDGCGNADPNYQGTLHLSCDDANATLPADYTFVAADNGHHTYATSLVLTRVGTRVVLVKDVNAPAMSAQGNVSVSPAVTSTLALSGVPTTITAGAALPAVLVQAQDAFGNLTPVYNGTVGFLSSDSAAALGNHTFVAGVDAGQYTFTNQLVMKSGGSQTLTAVDANHSLQSNTVSITVNANSTVSLRVTGLAGGLVPDVTYSVGVTPIDVYGNTQANYTGTVNVTSSDGSATLTSTPLTFSGGSPAMQSVSAVFHSVSVDVFTAQDQQVSTIKAVVNHRVDKAMALSVGSTGYHTCATLAGNGNTMCWGKNVHGGLGVGDTNDRANTPATLGMALSATALGTGRTAVALAVGGYYSCALMDNQQVKCWGANDSGQLGSENGSYYGKSAGTMGNALPTVNLGTGRTVNQIAAGSYHTCAILDNGQVKCWGANTRGQLGLGDYYPRGGTAYQMGDYLPAVALGTGRTARQVSCGGDATTTYSNTAAHTCVVLDSNQVKCWGYNGYAQLGVGDWGNRGEAPNQMGDVLPTVNLGTGRSAIAVATGLVFSCALLDTQQVKCWGQGGAALGVGDTATRGQSASSMGDALPIVRLGTGRSATRILAGGHHACAMLDDGGAKCWGTNSYGELGLGDTVSRGDSSSTMGDGLPEINVGTGRTIVDMALGYATTCALLDTHQVLCWGLNANGEVGVGDTTSRSSPVSAQVW